MHTSIETELPSAEGRLRGVEEDRLKSEFDVEALAVVIAAVNLVGGALWLTALNFRRSFLYYYCDCVGNKHERARH